MKKILTVLLFLFAFATSIVLAQEVRGIETRRVIYDGPRYSYGWSGEYHSTRYYGWEVTNQNSIRVSVDITLWSQARYQGDQNNIVKTQSLILKPGETYVFKREEHRSTKVDDPDSDNPISSYYIEYKAFKLQ